MKEKFKVLILNGSPRKDGNTTVAVKEMEKVFAENGVEYETIQIGNKALPATIAIRAGNVLLMMIS